MKRCSVLVTVALGLALLLVAVSGIAGTSTSTSTAQYRLGETIRFEIEDQKTCCWCCCCCCCCKPTCCDTQVLGWHITDACGVWVYSVVHDAPVSASTWEGSWPQTNSSGTQVSAGYYKLCVDTSVGTLSRCLKIYDPCRCCCWNPCTCWRRCSCNEIPSIKHCCCRTSLELVIKKPRCCFPFCWPCSSSCP